jgi:hypothetical protein
MTNSFNIPSATFTLRTCDLGTAPAPMSPASLITIYPLNAPYTYLQSESLVPIIPGTPNSIGNFNNQYKSSMSWYNVDLRQIMGEVMFNKYKTFSITLVTFVMTVASVVNQTGVVYENRASLINLHGLNFKNSTYSVADRCNKGIAQVGIFNVSSTVNIGTIVQQNSNASVVFAKSIPIVNLTISFTRVVDGLTSTGYGITSDQGNQFPHQFYQFRIEGIEEQN